MDPVSFSRKIDVTEDWFSNNIPTLQKLLQEKEFNPKRLTRILEIGCFEGLSTVWFLENVLQHRHSSITCIDTFRGGAEHESMGVDVKGSRNRFIKNCRPRAILNAEGRILYDAGGLVPFHLDPKSKVDLFIGESGPVLRRRFNFDYYDIVYIDGSHYQCDVLEDAVLSWPLLKMGGLLIFDDFGFHDPAHDLRPANGIIPFLNVYRNHVEVLAANWLLAVQKVENKRLPL